jgi:NAD+ synthase (glutamine-hydrolysing)
MNSLSNPSKYVPNQDYIRVATATPEVSIGDVSNNVKAIKKLYIDAVKAESSLVVFPELSITGYTIQDLVAHQSLLHAAERGLMEIAEATTSQNTVAVVGLPLKMGNAIYNCAAVVSEGEIRGIIPKQNLPTYNEFYEKRWYQAWENKQNTQVSINGVMVPFGTEQLFTIGDAVLGIEICEDLWVPEQPSTHLVANGATLIANPSASPEAVAKAHYRRGLVANTAARNVTGYVYSSADQTESTAEIVMSGHAMINEIGTMLAERTPFSQPQRMMTADIDLQHIAHDRLKTTDFPNRQGIIPTQTNIHPSQDTLERTIDAHPFVPKGRFENVDERLDTILNIQTTGLAMRLRSSHIKKVILGLSGGLDSTLALIAAIQAAEILKVSPGDLIHTLTMPGNASSDRTQNNAIKLAESLGIANEEIAIADLAKAQLQAINHGGEEDVTFENTQARIRQALVFNKANQLNGLALGTGDLSEIALGWCTYNGDHMSHYNVNASIPKTLVRTLVRHASTKLPATPTAIIEDILDTPVSPELTGNGISITQETEDLIGPYELHDFFLYHHLRWLEPKEKIGYLAIKAFEGQRTPEEIHKWLDVFMQRFYRNQWKRQAMPDGAKVGISLSPKGDWRMPPEIAFKSDIVY